MRNAFTLAILSFLSLASWAQAPAQRIEQALTTDGYGDEDSDSAIDPAIPITDATNAEPIVVSAEAHGLDNGAHVLIFGVLGNTAANGIWMIADVSTDTFMLVDSAGNGDYENESDAEGEGEGEGEGAVEAVPSGAAFPAFVYRPLSTQRVALETITITAYDGAFIPEKYMDVTALDARVFIFAFEGSTYWPIAGAARFIDWAGGGEVSVYTNTSGETPSAAAVARLDLKRDTGPLLLNGATGQGVALITLSDISGLTAQTATASGVIVSGPPVPGG